VAKALWNGTGVENPVMDFCRTDHAEAEVADVHRYPEITG
jgi:hypothetical protein